MTSTPLSNPDSPAFPTLAGGAVCGPGLTKREWLACELFARNHVRFGSCMAAAWREADAFFAVDPATRGRVEVGDVPDPEALARAMIEETLPTSLPDFKELLMRRARKRVANTIGKECADVVRQLIDPQDAPKPKADEAFGEVSHGEDVRQELPLGVRSDVPEAPHGGVLESRNAASSASAEAVADSLRADPGPTERGEGAVAGPSPLNQDDGAFASDEEDAALVAMGRELWSAFLQPGESLCSVGAITLDGDILEENYWTRAFPTNSTVLRNEARAILRRVRRERDAQGGSVAR